MAVLPGRTIEKSASYLRGCAPINAGCVRTFSVRTQTKGDGKLSEFPVDLRGTRIFGAQTLR